MFEDINIRNTPYWLNFVFNGRFFKFHHRFTIVAGATANIQALIGNRLCHIVSRHISFTGSGPVQADILESPTITNGTTPPIILSNLDRRSSKVPTTQFFVNPTGVSGGILIDRDILYTPSGPGGSAVRSTTFSNALWERILKPSASTVLSLTNQGGDTVDITIDVVFYESDN